MSEKEKEIKISLKLDCSECHCSLEFELDYLDDYMQLSVEPCDNLRCQSKKMADLRLLEQHIAAIAMNEDWDSLPDTEKCAGSKQAALKAIRAHNRRIMEKKAQTDAKKS